MLPKIILQESYRTHTTKGLRGMRIEDFVKRLSELMFAIIISGIINIVLIENKLFCYTQSKGDDKKSNLFPHVNETAASREWLEGNWK